MANRAHEIDEAWYPAEYLGMNERPEMSVSNLRDFETRLREACGHFVLHSARNKRPVEGLVSEAGKLGIRFISVCSNLQQLSRSRKEINLDQGDDFFLVIQAEGNALVSQHEASHWLQAGDMVLVDSVEPSEFTFFGEFNKLLFILLPREAILQKVRSDKTIGGNNLPKLDSVNVAISSVLEKFDLSEATNDELRGLLCDALFTLVGIMVSEEPPGAQIHRSPTSSGMDHALRISRQYIDSRYRDPKFSMSEMADTLRLSMRQVQRAFAVLGTTPTKYLLIKRLEHARKEIDQRIAGRRADLISTIAFEAGFSDLSYFQRTFRRAFGNTPRDYLSGIAEWIDED